MTILELAQARIPDLKKKTVKEWAGPCPECGGTDRFLVWVHREAWHCRGCDETGDAISFLRKFEGHTCPEAHAAIGKTCITYNCPFREKCSQGEKTARPVAAPLVPPKEQRDHWSPAPAVEPADLWREKAGALVAWAHEQLLENAEQLDYLAARGIPRAAVIEYNLGWNPGEKGRDAIFRERSAWGLPPKVVDGKNKKLWIPRGIVIPSRRDGQLQKVRIRRPNADRHTIDIPYYALEGGGDDVPVFNPGERAYVIVEADLCGVATAWACRGIAGVIPLASCEVKPKTWAASALDAALCILVATDHDPGVNEKTGRYKNPGGKAALWWSKHYPRAKRWPVPAGTDPGDYVKDHNGDLRAWVLAGLPPIFHIEKPIEKKPAPQIPEHAKGKTVNGHGYILAYEAEHVLLLKSLYPGDVVFSPREIAALKGMSKEDAELMLLAKKEFSGFIEGTVGL
jgi:hypothetical protein